MKRTKRRLRPWVINTFKTIAFIAVTIMLTFGTMFVMAEAHHQRAEYWSEVGGF